jgi:DNA-binding transcriptional LysR family regulator
MEAAMELRHLRYFIAVAEEGSLTVAAEKRLHTAQPSLSRQIRDLEYEVGVPLLTRSVHGVELTPAGRAFLDHARLALTQAEAAAEAARRAAQPVKPTFAIGFLIGRPSSPFCSAKGYRPSSERRIRRPAVPKSPSRAAPTR